jgi:hypothetical protein
MEEGSAKICQVISGMDSMTKKRQKKGCQRQPFQTHVLKL